MGFAVTDDPVVAESPVAGPHVYVSAPETVRLAPLPPEHTVAADGDAVSTGRGLIVRVVTVEVSERPDPEHVVTRR